MFKWSKLTFGPSTPKLTSVALPDEASLKRTQSPLRPSIPERKATMITTSGYTKPHVDKRSMTPHPPPTQQRHEARGQSSRLRTVSLSSSTLPDAGLKSALKKPSSGKPSNPVVSGSSHTSKGGSRMLDHSVSCAGSSKPLMDDGWSSHPAVSGKQYMDWSSQYPQDIKTMNVIIPNLNDYRPAYTADETHRPNPPVVQGRTRSRHNSVVDSRHHTYTTSDHTPKYMRAYIKEVPLKDEIISLSWPLTDYALRKHSRKPPVYFDVGFNPSGDPQNLRAHRGGISTPLSRDEYEMPVSPQTEMTDLEIITGSPLNKWPVRIHGRKGLRCIDVFQAIFDTYNVPLTPEELSTLDPAYYARCVPAFKQRCLDSPGLPLFNEKCGMRRVDLLRGHRIFGGLTRASNGRWQLHFERI